MSVAQYSPDSLEALLRNLSITEDEPDHEEILKHANNVLKTAKGNHRALHTKIVALLNLDRHEDALRALNSNDGRQIADLSVIERAYCLYKVGKLEEAVELTARAKVDGRKGRGLKHIAAQVYYRLENFEKVSELLQSLVAGGYSAPNEQGDLGVNSTATHAQLTWSGKKDLVADKKASREDLDVFEATFNAACLCIARNELGQATVLLKRARQLCNALEDLTEEEKEAELEPVTVQEMYISMRTGQHDRARDLAATFDVKNVSDDALQLIATINRTAIDSLSDEYNPYLAFQAYSEATKSSKPSAARPFGFQSKVIQLDEAILDLSIGKSSAAREKARNRQSLYASEKGFRVVDIAAQTLHKTDQETEKEMERLFATDVKDIGLALTLVQLRMGRGNITGAINVMESLTSNLEPAQRYQPGLVGLLVALYEHQGRKQHVRKVLSEASEWSKNTDNPNSSILYAAGKSTLDSDKASDLTTAGKIFSYLFSKNPSDRTLIAGLVASYATTDPSNISGHVDSLTSVETLISGVDVASLESAGVAQPLRKRGAEEDTSSPTKPKKSRKTKPRLPKDYDASKKPDPERWLPMRDRSYYKPKGKKEKKKAAAATQGGAVEESMELAGGGRIDVVKVEQAKKASGGGGANKKKKKKGGKR